MNLKRSLCLTPLLAGCYSYTPIAPAAVPVGSEVRARITGSASDKVAPLIGQFNTRELIGSVVENREGELILEVPSGAMPNVAADVVRLQSRVPLAPPDLVTFEQRRIDVVRTSVLTGGILAAIGAGVIVALRSGGSGDEGKGPPEPPPINRIPIRIFRIAF